jgi:protein-S-isoprenylcysteine O-methyltransferase Ste14
MEHMDYKQISAFIIWLVFYTAYITKMILLRRQGIKRSILGKNAFEVGLLIVTYGGAGVQIFSILFPSAVPGLTSFSAVHWLGIALMIFGTGFFVTAMIIMRNNWRAGFTDNQNTKLVTNGIYRVSRNPAFVGFDLLYIGCAFSFPNIVNIVAAVTALIMFHFPILSEERFLERAFGNEYRNYQKTVRRYIGRKS